MAPPSLAAIESGATPTQQLALRRLRGRAGRIAAGLVARVLGAAEGRTVLDVARRELRLILRSREWHRFTGLWMLFATALLILPFLWRTELGSWNTPRGSDWLLGGSYTVQVGLWAAMAQWTVRRLRRDLYTNRLDELMLTRCSPADLALGEALASAVAGMWLVCATFPILLILSAVGGQGWACASRMTLCLAPAAALGVWFGMGWGLAFTLRSTSTIVPLTEWWLMGPLFPAIVAWAIGGLYALLLGFLSLVPGGHAALSQVVALVRWLGTHLLWHWNPVLAPGAAVGAWDSSWATNWAMLCVFVLFMMRKSTDAVQRALAVLPERTSVRGKVDFWVHHDVHFFTDYSQERRRQPAYYDGGNPVAAFDVALGHRVFLHPFLWTICLLAYLFLLGWSVLMPGLGKGTATVAVLLPATIALLLMSGGVAVSFGWERDQHRWPDLASLPIPNDRLALGKIKGVVRPTLWVALIACLTALFMGWRGALPWGTALWMALHVVTFPVALAGVAAVLALTTPTVGEALYRWMVLGALPTLATILPHPIGGPAGIALPFTPPLLVLMLVIHGATPELVRTAWISLGLQVAGVLGALLILRLFLRRWTVGEKG